MDPAQQLQIAVKEAVELAVSHLYPKIKSLVAAEITRLFTQPHIQLTLTGKVKRQLTATQMRCRYPGCKKRSQGPKFHYRCASHPADAIILGVRPNLRIIKGGQTRPKAKGRAKAA
jgi:hypothetical protein